MRFTGSLWLVSSVAAFAAAIYIDVAIIGVGLLAEGQPSFEGPQLWKTLLTVLGSGLLVASIARGAAGTPGTANDWRATWDGWGTIRWIRADRMGSVIASITAKQAVLWWLALLSGACVALFLWKPRFFSVFAREDRLVESLSAAFLLFSAGTFAYIVFRLKNRRSATLAIKLLAAAFAIVFFVIAMEEISWFQRHLGFATPEAFSANTQSEMNFHNFVTNETENAYYFGAFVLLVLIPFLIDTGTTFGGSMIVRTFAPSTVALFAGSISVAYTYDMWNGILMQTAFFVTLFILARYAVVARGTAERWLPVGFLFLLVLSQAVFLRYGGRFVRDWDVTEYRELWIPIAFLVYALEVVHRVTRGANGESTRTCNERDG